MLVGLLPVSDFKLTCKAPESIETFILLLIRKFFSWVYSIFPLANRSHSYSFYSRRSDLANERLPEFQTAHPMIFQVPLASMRLTSRRYSENMDMEYLIKRTLDEDGDDEGGIVEKLAEKI